MLATLFNEALCTAASAASTVDKLYWSSGQCQKLPTEQAPCNEIAGYQWSGDECLKTPGAWEALGLGNQIGVGIGAAVVGALLIETARARNKKRTSIARAVWNRLSLVRVFKGAATKFFIDSSGELKEGNPGAGEKRIRQGRKGLYVDDGKQRKYIPVDEDGKYFTKADLIKSYL